MNIRSERRKTSGKVVEIQEERERERESRSRQTELNAEREREHGKENDLAVTHVDHYLLLHKM